MFKSEKKELSLLEREGGAVIERGSGWLCTEEVGVVYDDQSSGQRSQRVVAFSSISHMEWQILLTTGMPTVILNRH